METKIIHRKLNVEEYRKMVEAGILHEDDRVELINGQIIEMIPIGSRHVAFVNKISHILNNILADSAIISVQNPILLSQFTEPEPDISVLRFRNDFYIDNLPEPNDILWLIEIADTSLGYDTEVKLPLYAMAGIQEVWIVDLTHNDVKVHQQPVEDSYTLISVYQSGGKIFLQPHQISIEVDQLLP